LRTFEALEIFNLSDLIMINYGAIFVKKGKLNYLV